jgi:protein tyrosine phosphatase (PTP) superfamily phosphohydrolase (DUF442 family)
MRGLRTGWGWVLLAVAGCGPSGLRLPAPGEVLEAPGLHNVLRVTDKLYSGSSPDGDAGFRSLRALGVRTVISVDGARPDVGRAHAFGLRYVHLPIGYDGVPEAQGRRLARAVRDLPGPVYAHCHQGKHRGPAAAVVARRCLDAGCGADAALALLRKAGTDPHYTGLYASAARFQPLSAAELDQVSADFPEVSPVPALAEWMVAVDELWDRIKEVRAAGWTAPPAHPDLDPAHEALQLVEAYREAGRLPDVARRPEELRRWLTEAEQAAQDLEAALRRGPDRPAAEAAYGRSAAACARCHGRYRDVPP